MNCYEATVIPSCSRCNKKIKNIDNETGSGVSSQSYLKVNNKIFHTECFNCIECKKPFEDKKAYGTFFFMGNSFFSLARER